MALRDRTDWFDIWYEDKTSIIDIMTKNMASDLEHGYDYFGKSITEQRKMIEDYKQKFDDEMEAFKFMDAGRVNQWCYFDLKKRGAIE